MPRKAPAAAPQSPATVPAPAASVKIEKGVPLPSTRKTRLVYPWDKMEVGDSVLIPTATGPDVQKVRQSLSYYSKKHARTYTTRKQGAALRVWRTK